MTKFGQLFGRIYKRTKDNFFIIYSRTWLSSYLATAGYLAKNYKVYVVCIMQKLSSIGVLRKRSSGNMDQIYKRTPVPKCDFNKVALLSRKFAAYFQNTFSKEHLWTAASDYVRKGIWSKSVTKKLQFDERNKFLNFLNFWTTYLQGYFICYARRDYFFQCIFALNKRFIPQNWKVLNFVN